MVYIPCPITAYTDKPTKIQWATDGEKVGLLKWLIDGCCNETFLTCPNDEPEEVEYEGYDGFYNNLARPDLGAVGMSSYYYHHNHHHYNYYYYDYYCCCF
jgi:hypothetical protein